jgi:hypothetical protein
VFQGLPLFIRIVLFMIVVAFVLVVIILSVAGVIDSLWTIILIIAMGVGAVVFGKKFNKR